MNGVVYTPLNIKGPSFTNVGPGNTAVVKPDLGRTQRAWKLLLGGGLTVANITEIRCLINDRVVRTISGSDLNKENIAFGLQDATTTNVLPVYWVDPQNRTEGAIEALALGTGIQQVNGQQADANGNAWSPYNMYMQVDIAAAAAAASTLQLDLSESAPTIAGGVRHVYQTSFPSQTVIGENQMADLGRGKLLKRVIFKSANVSRVQLLIGNRVVFDRLRANNDQDIIDASQGRTTPPADWFMIEPDMAGFGNGAIDLRNVQSFRWNIWDTAAETLPIQYETVEAAIQA